MKVCLIVKSGQLDSGVGRYALNLEAALRREGHDVVAVNPIILLPGWLGQGVKRRLRWDLDAFFNTYPIWADYPEADLYHFTSQNLATLLLFHPPRGPVVVTVHDIIPYLLRKQGMTEGQPWWTQVFDCLSNRGLRKAWLLICDSAFTRQSLIQEFGFSPANLHVIPLGIGTPLA